MNLMVVSAKISKLLDGGFGAGVCKRKKHGRLEYV